MTDPLFPIGPNGGDLVVDGGDLLLSNGLENAAAISLFGGNKDDSGTSADDSVQFWGNLIGQDPDEVIRSETQALLEGLPQISANLVLIEEAAARDLAWMTNEIADAVEVSASYPDRNRVDLDVEITVNSENFPFQFTAEWQGQR